jgi:hypothetical protein
MGEIFFHEGGCKLILLLTEFFVEASISRESREIAESQLCNQELMLTDANPESARKREGV